MTWSNSDGLFVKFGAEEAQVAAGGVKVTAGGQRLIEVEIDDMTDLTTTAAIIGSVDNPGAFGVVVPKGARVEKVELITTTAVTSGGSATLDIGFVAEDRSTAYDDDGLIAAGAIATFNSEGETVEYTAGSTGAGALVGTVLANDGILVASYNTAAFTAGAVKIRVYYA